MKKKNSPIKCCQSKSLSAIYEVLMKEKFQADDAHEDVTALVKVLFGSSLRISRNELIASSICSRDFVLSMQTGQQAKARKSTLQEVPVCDGMKEKLANAGLDNTTLTRIFQQRGAKGLLSVLALPEKYDQVSCKNARPREICPEMHANEMHELYERHHKVSPTLNSY